MSPFDVRNSKSRYYFYNKYLTTIKTWLMCGFIPKNTFIHKQVNLYLQQKKEKNVIKNVSNLKQQHKCLLQNNVIESNKKMYIKS